MRAQQQTQRHVSGKSQLDMHTLSAPGLALVCLIRRATSLRGVHMRTVISILAAVNLCSTNQSVVEYEGSSRRGAQPTGLTSRQSGRIGRRR